MTKRIRIGIAGYGKLGKGTETAIMQNEDMELVAVVTRRDPSCLNLKTKNALAVSMSDIETLKDRIDVMVICCGSATDLPEMSPKLAGMFNVIDSFDTHQNIPKHFEAVDISAKAGGHLALISAGWDPGYFSLMRLYAASVLPEGDDYTFWGPGVSQGHSDAIRRIPGVVNATQYTVPIECTVEAVRNGDCPCLTAGQKHTRECYVVVEEGSDKESIEKKIRSMPNYFVGYDTTVTFISAEQMQAEHCTLPHGGFVIRNGRTGLNKENKHTIEFRLALESNPEFTSSFLVACARAIHRLSSRGETGCRTVFDIPPALMSPLSPEQLRSTML
ncbi:MAG: diaminopimelate dehydrogenase [Synergistaceae bacterium]|nr:diaminopimelate dehydrogenase [Synergistaceae bacterium]